MGRVDVKDQLRYMSEFEIVLNNDHDALVAGIMDLDKTDRDKFVEGLKIELSDATNAVKHFLTRIGDVE